jgi:hypothetical protein
MSDEQEGWWTPHKIVFICVCIVALGLGFKLAKFLIIDQELAKRQKAKERLAQMDMPEQKASKLSKEEQEKQLAGDKEVVNKLMASGEKFLKPRNIDHWIFFAKDKPTDKFIAWAKNEGYAVEGPEPTQKGEIKVKLSHTGVPTPEAINKHTLRLAEGAKEYGGEYDGWETLVVKE